MEIVNFLPDSVHYRFRRRSCSNCIAFSWCHAMTGKDWSCQWLDLGKCGCKKYNGRHKKEKPYKEKILEEHE